MSVHCALTSNLAALVVLICVLVECFLVALRLVLESIPYADKSFVNDMPNATELLSEFNANGSSAFISSTAAFPICGPILHGCSLILLTGFEIEVILKICLLNYDRWTMPNLMPLCDVMVVSICFIADVVMATNPSLPRTNLLCVLFLLLLRLWILPSLCKVLWHCDEKSENVEIVDQLTQQLNEALKRLELAYIKSEDLQAELRRVCLQNEKATSASSCHLTAKEPLPKHTANRDLGGKQHELPSPALIATNSPLQRVLSGINTFSSNAASVCKRFNSVPLRIKSNIGTSSHASAAPTNAEADKCKKPALMTASDSGYGSVRGDKERLRYRSPAGALVAKIGSIGQGKPVVRPASIAYINEAFELSSNFYRPALASSSCERKNKILCEGDPSLMEWIEIKRVSNIPLKMKADTPSTEL